MIFDVDYFIAKFDAIPENLWTIKKYVDDKGCMCALGHCGARVNESIQKVTEESLALNLLFTDVINVNVVSVNDRIINVFGGTPKKRILNALVTIKALQEVGGL